MTAPVASEVRPLGRDYTRVLAASTISALGDGIALAAGPLLVASITESPLLVAGAAFAQQLPWLLFSLVFGAYVDRWDRKRLLVGVNLFLAVATGSLGVAVFTGVGTLPVIYLCLFALGSGEILARSASDAVLTAVVAAPDLPRANARLYGGYTLGTHLVGPPLGAALFLLTPSVPFLVDALSFLLAMLLLRRLRLPAGDRDAGGGLRAEIREGIAWLWQQRLLRLVAVCICVMNLTFGGTMAVFVLYARQQLGLGAQGYGFLLSVSAVGGLLGATLVPRLVSRWGTAVLLRAGLLIEAATQLALGLTHQALVAAVVMLVFGVHATVWGVITMSLRQRVVPDALRGRISGVYMLFSAGGMAVGSALGGVVASIGGISAPYLLAAFVVGSLCLVSWRRLAETG